MGLFTKKQKVVNDDPIVSVVILEQTQLYKNKSNLGVTFGSTFGDGQVIAMDGSVPSGAEIKFSVTYKSGRQEIVKAKSGTAECDRLLQLAIDPPHVSETASQPNEAKEYTPVSLKKNQLSGGKYLIGRDIPAGTYDLTWVWGAATVMKFVDDHDTTLGATNYLQHMGNKYEYQYRQCLNIQCLDGEVLSIDGNVIVEISKSKPIEIDL